MEEFKKSLNKYIDIDGMLHYYKLLFIPEIIWTKLISRNHNNSPVDFFDINKTKKLIGQKYF